MKIMINEKNKAILNYLSKDDHKPALKGVNVYKGEDGSIYLIGCDSFKLYHCKAEIYDLEYFVDKEINYILPASIVAHHFKDKRKKTLIPYIEILADGVCQSVSGEQKMIANLINETYPPALELLQKRQSSVGDLYFEYTANNLKNAMTNVEGVVKFYMHKDHLETYMVGDGFTGVIMPIRDGSNFSGLRNKIIPKVHALQRDIEARENVLKTEDDPDRITNIKNVISQYKKDEFELHCKINGNYNKLETFDINDIEELGYNIADYDIDDVIDKVKYGIMSHYSIVLRAVLDELKK